ncbi:MAE_28990/MAE_18760 family HEPN-like nuclease [Lentilactobacillus kefiri]|uniref:MAE_28990/MAE_18760 family HEPN-like nuclease n=1 Tax=Lentilactobacillus kefiri TaxID=33962 RepID=UPI0006EF6C8A|nr:MAE_28990/MAE_18760 family HEPN-like nuclease [Lentilactobacillus kefiri]KRL73516.1 hypothetical protein FD08_GL002503 [Lentilactobacillus parakefiri DSM 10551]
MVKINTLEKLQDKIDFELSWRKKEIIKLDFNIYQARIHGNAKFTIREGYLLLYADWEGFIRTVANYYVIFVFSKKYKLKNLSTGFWVIYNFSEFNKIYKSPRKKADKSFVDNLITTLDKSTNKSYIDKVKKRFINTNSNLNYDRFSEILYILGLDYNKYSLKKNYIDSVLLKNRNSIAHGENMKFTFTSDDVDEFRQALKIIIEIMNSFKEDILNAAINENFINHSLFN